MLAKLLLLFTIVPLVELFLLFRVAEVIGGGTTVVIVAATGFFGVFLAKTQGLKVLRETRASMSMGEMPANSLIDGIFILIGGAFLLTPGLITDAAGFMFLFPVTRSIFKGYAIRKIKQMIEDGNFYIYRG